MKTNLNFYQRRTDAYRHPKFKTLRISYGGGNDGWAAEGRFWALNDIIAESEMCQIDLSKQRNKAMIADTLGLSFEELDQFIHILTSTDIELLYEIDTEVYTTKKLKDTLSSVLIEREKARKRKGAPEKRKSSGENVESSDELNNIVKDSKVKESIREESKSKLDENQNENPTLTSENFSSPTSYLFTPKDYDNDDQVRATVVLMLARYCKITAPEKAEISRFFNIITKTENVSRKTAHRIALETFQKYPSFNEKKRNLPYLSTTIEGKLNDALIAHRENKARIGKNDHLKENENLLNTKSISDGTDDLISTFKDAVTSFSTEHKIE